MQRAKKNKAYEISTLYSKFIFNNLFKISHHAIKKFTGRRRLDVLKLNNCKPCAGFYKYNSKNIKLQIK